jgi:hypothetical protein
MSEASKPRAGATSSSSKDTSKKTSVKKETPSPDRSTLDAPVLSDSSLQFWLPSDITSDEDVARDTFGASRLRELKEA